MYIQLHSTLSYYKTHKHGYVLHVSVLTVYSVTTYFFILHGTAWVCSSVLFMDDVLKHCACCQSLYHFQYIFHYWPTNVVLLWLAEGWRWASRMLVFCKEVSNVIVVFGHNKSLHPPPLQAGSRGVNSDVTAYVVSRFLMLFQDMSKNESEPKTHKTHLALKFMVCCSGLWSVWNLYITTEMFLQTLFSVSIVTVWLT